MTRHGSQIWSAMPQAIIYDELCNHSGLNQKTYCKDNIWTKNDISLNLPALKTNNQSIIFLNIIASMQENP